MAKRYRRQVGKKLGVLRVVPISCELIRGPDENRFAIELEGLGRLQPSLEGLFRNLLASSV